MEEKLKLSVYKKNNNNSFFSIFIEGISNLINSNYLAFQLAKRDIKGQYRQSFLGILWSLFTPISTAVIWIVLKSSGTISMADSGVNYVLYVFIGTMSWSILVDSINGPILGTLSMKATLSKINFPKEALILSSVYITLFNTFIKLFILSCLLLYFKQSISLSLLFFPLTLIAIFIFGTAAGLLVTPLGLLYGDVSRLIVPALQLLMYISPVVFVYPSMDSFYGKIMYYNPLSPLINNLRNSLLGFEFQQLDYYLIIVLCSSIVFAFALVFYKITIPIITEKIS